MSDSDPGDRAMFWFNVVGISLAAGLLGTFFWFYGKGFLSLIAFLFIGPQDWPDH